ncbi:hypothetical protein HK104_010331 [Borealophlyctis nickersoniae]|nr:hypothetical protein HK104_010331 [Borealophlyctis nickersoniae]
MAWEYPFLEKVEFDFCMEVDIGVISLEGPERELLRRANSKAAQLGYDDKVARTREELAQGLIALGWKTDWAHLRYADEQVVGRKSVLEWHVHFITRPTWAQIAPTGVAPTSSPSPTPPPPSTVPPPTGPPFREFTSGGDVQAAVAALRDAARSELAVTGAFYATDSMQFVQHWININEQIDGHAILVFTIPNSWLDTLKVHRSVTQISMDALAPLPHLKDPKMLSLDLFARSALGRFESEEDE